MTLNINIQYITDIKAFPPHCFTFRKDTPLFYQFRNFQHMCELIETKNRSWNRIKSVYKMVTDKLFTWTKTYMDCVLWTILWTYWSVHYQIEFTHHLLWWSVWSAGKQSLSIARLTSAHLCIVFIYTRTALSDIPLPITPPLSLSDFMRICSMDKSPSSCPFFLRTLYCVIAKKELLKQKWMLLLHFLHWLKVGTTYLYMIVVPAAAKRLSILLVAPICNDQLLVLSALMKTWTMWIYWL